MIKVRRVLYGEKGFEAGEYIGEFYQGNMQKAFEHYTEIWMELYTDKEGNIIKDISEKDADYVDEFTFVSVDHIFIGLPGTICYEIIDDEIYKVYSLGETDKYGFEQMKDSNGKNIPYTDFPGNAGALIGDKPKNK